MAGIDTQTIQAFRNRYIGQLTTRTGFGPTSITPSNKQQMSRTGHFARDHIVAVRLVLANYAVNSSGVEVGTGGPASFTASVEYPAGVFNQARFSGEVTGIAPSASIIVSDLTKVTVPKGKRLWAKVWRADPLGIIYNSFTWFKSTATHGDAFNFSTTTVPDTTMSATATNLDANNLYVPLAIIGYTRRGSVLILGDSLPTGQNDTGDASGDVGLFRYIGAARGYINGARPGDRAMWFKDNSVLRRSLGQYVSDIIVQHTINDIGSGGRSVAEVQADLTTIGNLLRADYPTKRLWLATSIPQTADSTNAAPGTNETKRVQLNDWKRTTPDPYDGCIELADAVENSRNGGLFASGTYINTDGTHMTAAGYTAIAPSGFVDESVFGFGS
jgi:lysophospholipase L1-like esterase